MKRLFSLLLVSSLMCLSPFTFAGGDLCSGKICYFNSLINSNGHSQFYCNVKGDVSEVRLVTHNVVVTGFKESNPDAGTLNLIGSSRVNDLKTHYFDVKNDPKHKKSFIKTVVVEIPWDNSVECHIGTGGRQSVYDGKHSRWF